MTHQPVATHTLYWKDWASFEQSWKGEEHTLGDQHYADPCGHLTRPASHTTSGSKTFQPGGSYADSSPLKEHIHFQMRDIIEGKSPAPESANVLDSDYCESPNTWETYSHTSPTSQEAASPGWSETSQFLRGLLITEYERQLLLDEVTSTPNGSDTIITQDESQSKAPTAHRTEYHDLETSLWTSFDDLVQYMTGGEN